MTECAISAVRDEIAILLTSLFRTLDQLGVREYCIAAGKRNAPVLNSLCEKEDIERFFWPEERSGSFFALGRARASKRPVVMLTTSGTAVAELLPATMEAHYSGVPLILLTADRPRRFRKTGAPQSVEQVGIFQEYVSQSCDFAEGEECLIVGWDRASPLHINVCLEEPLDVTVFAEKEKETPFQPEQKGAAFTPTLDSFLEQAQAPLVLVGALKEEEREPVLQFLRKLSAPVLLEESSGLREEGSLEGVRLYRRGKIWQAAKESGYPIDAILRLGGVPTNRLWRDLEESLQEVPVFSLSSLPFSGLASMPYRFFSHYPLSELRYQPKEVGTSPSRWLREELRYRERAEEKFERLDRAEPSLVHALSEKIPSKGLVYLGNSMPIRQWDLAASWSVPHSRVFASRGANGIDGQLSTFLGLTEEKEENWAIVGDLTLLYDMAAFWIIPQLTERNLQIVVINNGGGKIFSRVLSSPHFQNCHNLNFSHLAALWGLSYERWEEIPHTTTSSHSRLIEIVPSEEETELFWKEIKDE